MNLPDGRNEPLTVGYHKVSVEIRDQIARTTIEESFVNHTAGRLEGVFHFPLPQDASISGFGMWIGDELVEADVVEKQRAREIYETILRERRDPGLLEWTTGNLFKARVFPIEPRSEKRVKIVYTQVLPLRANQYRYTYGLRSDLLRTKPVRELSLSVTVDSALPLKKIACPTHSARLQQAEHSAQVEFAAQDYSPERDFEVVCEIDGRQSDVVVIPHRRGDDGYLLVQLMPPGVEGNWQREILPEGAPLSLVLLCDTSGSMDSEKRKQQSEFVAAVLSSLGDKDRFWLAATDTATSWHNVEPRAATPDHIAQAQDFLARRISLGWTDLDQALQAVLQKIPAEAQVIYIGDGLVTAGDRSPAAFVKLLAKRRSELLAGKQDGHAPTFHTVSVGNTHEAVVLRGIADIGGGSSRAIGGERSPQAVALELLSELAQPGWRDLQVEFRGARVAAVYPDRLPNVAAGTQQVLVGRYLPAGKEQTGEVVVTGERGSESVRYVAKVRFPDADEGNSFIPRLWARAHLDHLLAQGSSPAIQDEIIGLSEEYHIMTPYTSLLVLETDADRERFGVKRRYEMRDGERFFQQGRDDATFELAQQQMLRAGDWRLELRRQVLRRLATLGRDPQIFQQHARDLGFREASYGYLSLGRTSGFLKSGSGTLVLNDSNSYTGGTSVTSGTLTLNGGAFWADNLSELEVLSAPVAGPVSEGSALYGDKLALRDVSGEERSFADGSKNDLTTDVDRLLALDSSPIQEAAAKSLGFSPAADEPMSGFYDEWKSSRKDRSFGSGGKLIAGKRRSNWDRYEYGVDYSSWLNELFPGLSTPPSPPQTFVKPSSWSPEALAVAETLLRDEALKKLKGGIAFESKSETFDPVWNRRTSCSAELTLYSPTAWLTKPEVTDGNRIVNYCDEKRRGVFSLSLLLGQSRPAVERDRICTAFPFQDWAHTPLYVSYPAAVVGLEQAGEGQVRLVIEYLNSTYVRKTLIDTAKRVVLATEDSSDGRTTSKSEHSNFVEVGGLWWWRKVVTTDAEGRKISESTFAVQALDSEQFAARFAAETAPLAKVQVLQQPLPKLSDARRRVNDGSATFDDRIVMMLHEGIFRQWDELLKHLDAAEKLAHDKPGVPRLRTVILGVIRRHEEARRRLSSEARELVANPQPDELFLAQFLAGQDQRTSAPSEQLAFLEILRPIYERQPEDAQAEMRLRDRLIQAYQNQGRNDEALPLLKAQAEGAPWETHRQTAYAQTLATAGRFDEAYAWLDRQLALPNKRMGYDDDTLRTGYADLLRRQANWEELLAWTRRWIERKPENPTGYEHHLSALIHNNQVDTAYQTAERWLQEARAEGKAAPDVRARLNAALRLAQGYISNLSLDRLDERLHKPFADTVRFFLRRSEEIDLVRQIMNSRFRDTEAADRLRAEMLLLLSSDGAKLSVAQLQFYVEQTLSGRVDFAQVVEGRRQMDAAEVPEAIWKPIASRLRTRWDEAGGKDSAAEEQTRYLLGATLVTIYRARFADTELLPFLRRQVEVGGKDYLTQYRTLLFEELLVRPWSEQAEEEAFALLPKLSNADTVGARLAAQVPALHRFVDGMAASRQTAARKQLTDGGDVGRLTRTELAGKLAEFRKSAYEGLAKRLSVGLAKVTEQKDPWTDWLEIELSWLNMQLDQDLDKTAAFCRRILGDVPPKEFDPSASDASPEQIVEHSYSALLRRRALATLMNLAARQGAKPDAATQLLRYLDAGIAAGDDDAEAWRFAKYELLVALDRPDDLERELRDWIRTDVATAPWRQSLALLVAERGNLDEAIQLFEAAEKLQLLDAADYRTLADWYLARNRREDHDRTLPAIFQHVPEYQLSNLIHSMQNRRRQAGDAAPADSDELMLAAFRAIFETAAQPENYLYLLHEQYRQNHDFRMLAMLPDSVLGRSPQQIYKFLIAIKERVLYDLRNEAAADEIVARIKTLQAGERSATDLRALDLLEAIVERQAAEVLNQKGPHVDACLAALKRAFARRSKDGEPAAMAEYLAALGSLPAPALVEEQLNQLRALREAAPDAGRDRLYITRELCKLLFRSYDRKPEALQTFEAELAAYEQAHDGRLPFEDDAVLDDYVAMLSDAGRHAAAEAVLQKHLERPVHEEQSRWLLGRLSHYYNIALERRGEVSLGSGEALFAALIDFGHKQIEAATDDNVRYERVAQLVATFDVARRLPLAGIETPLKQLAFKHMPQILRKQMNNYGNTAALPTSAISEVLGPKDALRYVVECMEHWPQAMQFNWNSSWGQMGSMLADYRWTAAQQKVALGDLEPRVLALVIAELKRDLRIGEGRRREIYYLHHGRFWQEKADDFAAAAEEVYRERKSSGRGVAYVAEYLRRGLERHARSVEILLIAHADGLLDVRDQVRLVEFLNEDKRYAESIVLLEPLVPRVPTSCSIGPSSCGPTSIRNGANNLRNWSSRPTNISAKREGGPI
ncbi:MAG: VIT domain-containing protein [Pirellulales bacterium]